MLDAVTIEILWSRITSIVDEAAKVIIRTSFSTLSNEANDFACVLTDENGHSIAQNTGSIPSFIGTLPATVRHFLGEFGPSKPDGEMGEGDVYITNNPGQGTGHLPDVCLVKPIFRNGRLVAFSAACSHVPDIGGMVRSVEPREVFEEGFHIPLMRLIRDGVPDATLLKLLRTNLRTPDQTVGAIWAPPPGDPSGPRSAVPSPLPQGRSGRRTPCRPPRARPGRGGPSQPPRPFARGAPRHHPPFPPHDRAAHQRGQMPPGAEPAEQRRHVPS